MACGPAELTGPLTRDASSNSGTVTTHEFRRNRDVGGQANSQSVLDLPVSDLPSLIYLSLIHPEAEFKLASSTSRELVLKEQLKPIVRS